jgi:hypothetical protein
MAALSRVWAFGSRRTIVAAVLVLAMVVLGLALPAVSMAGASPCSLSDVHETCQIKVTSIQTGGKGVELTLLIGQVVQDGYGGVIKFNTLDGGLIRHQGDATENDYYYLSESGHLNFTWGKTSLQFARIKGTFGLGRGSIDLTFHAAGPPRQVRVPRGCRGHGGERQPDTLSGSLMLHAGKLSVLTHKSFKATISTAEYTCFKPMRGYHVYTNRRPGPHVNVFKPNSTGPVSETITVSGEWATYIYTVSGLPSSDYTLNPSTLSTAHVKGGGGISGTATYNSTQSSAKLTTGRMGGSLAVTFASIGKVTVFPNSQAAKQFLAPGAR